MTISPARQIRLLPFDEVQLKTEPSYLVKGLIPRVGTTLVWGPPKSWKTFWTFDVMAHVALDRAYRGRKVSGGPVAIAPLRASTATARGLPRSRSVTFLTAVTCHYISLALELISRPITSPH